jgi:hypothetical protein
LLANERFGKFWAEHWRNLLIPQDSNTKKLSTEPLLTWLADAFNHNKPWDKTVHELLTASGAQNKNGAITFYLGNPTADKMTDEVSRLFLGIQLQCAQCHDHPFTGWKRKEYWGMAAFFTKVQVGNVKQAAKKGNTVSVSENPESKKKQKLPESAMTVAPKFLQGAEPRIAKDAPARPVLARWLTAPDNPYFARAMVNRTWAHFFGRGIIQPLDDMHEGNAASHPALLANLAEQFKDNGFDVKYLIRAICNSQTYQRSSRAVDSSKSLPELFDHMALRVLSPEQLYDSLAAVVGDAKPESRKEKKPANGKKAGGTPRTQFIDFFHVGDNANPVEYQAGIPQALRLLNSSMTNNNAPAINQAMKDVSSPAQVIDRLYLTALARRPTAAEQERLVRYVSTHQQGARGAYGDILWAILNSSEFAVNH